MGYYDERYPVSIDIVIGHACCGKLDCFIDSIKGLNVGHALWRARDNWPDSKVTLLGLTK